MNIKDLTILKASKALKSGEFSCTDLIKSFLKEINKKEKKINAFITLFEDEALKQAKEKDKKSYKHKGILDGIPIIIKDNILLKDKKCSAGSKILKNYKASYDAYVVEQLKKAGAIILGKGNMDEFACGSSGETSYFGPTKNPINTKKVPGGSSSGPAAALASKFVLGGLGSDTGGSIRQPASFCGIYGLKPTYGRVSRFGLIAMASSLDQIGPMALSIDDLGIILNSIQGRDKKDSTSIEVTDIKIPIKKKKPKKIKIGLIKDLEDPKNKKQKQVFENTVSKLKEGGVEFVDINLPNLKYALAAYYIIMPAEISANLARFDGIRYGFRKNKKDLLDIYKKTRTKGFGEEVKTRIMLGNFTLSHGYHDKYYLKAQKVRTLIKNDFNNAFDKDIDAILLPTTPETAFELGEKIDNPIDMYLSDVYTVPANLAGLPALSMPSKFVDGLPTGLQIIGNHFEEEKILQIAKTIENIL